MHTRRRPPPPQKMQGALREDIAEAAAPNEDIFRLLSNMMNTAESDEIEVCSRVAVESIMVGCSNKAAAAWQDLSLCLIYPDVKCDQKNGPNALLGR